MSVFCGNDAFSFYFVKGELSARSTLFRAAALQRAARFRLARAAIKSGT